MNNIRPDEDIVKDLQKKKREYLLKALELMDRGALFISEPTFEQNLKLLLDGRVEVSRQKFLGLVKEYKEMYNAKSYVDKETGKRRFVELEF